MVRHKLDKQHVAAQEDDPGKLVRRCGTRPAMQLKRRIVHYSPAVWDPTCNAVEEAYCAL
jgi:hypothetical protein